MGIALICVYAAIFGAFLERNVVVCQANDEWNPVNISKSLLDDMTLTKQRKILPTQSDVICALVATRSRWANLFCFKDGMCDISDYVAVSNESQISKSDPVECMTKLKGISSTIQHPTTTSSGANILTPTPPTVDTSTPSPLGSTTTTQIFTTATCIQPYILKLPYGCYLKGTGSVLWIEARNYCIGKGGDLASFAGFSTGDLNAFITQFYPVDFVHIGFKGTNSSYHWVNGTPFSSTDVLLWNTGYPSASLGPKCGRTTNIWTELFGDDNCTARLNFICQMPFQPA